MSARWVIIGGAACVAIALGGEWAMSAPSVAPADEAPRGMVAFVEGSSCPTGWVPANIAAGRLLVGTDQMTAVGRVVGEPLTPEEDRAHDHTLTGAALSLPYKSISAADGSNNSGASSGAQPVTGTVAAATSGLPLVQLTACVSP